MTPDRWKLIEQLYHSALKQQPSRRSAFLQEACGGDETLRREVESLLAHQQSSEGFIEAPALEVAAKLMDEKHTVTLVGRQIGAYKILSLLGAGGMGEVYLAQDPRLDRTIALKILPTELASDPDRMRRFVREAKAASALKHPNVAHIYEIGESEGSTFIAMEYVEGQTLATRIGGRPLDPAGIVEIGMQIADALDEAHAKGITHRDIKPANIMLTARGQVKVLDFGLAKVIRPEEQAGGSHLSTVAKTETGVVMGTVQYMSPEQVLGREVDHRTDIFSLGVVLYEMATGRLPFSGATTNETMDRILHAQPEAIARFNRSLPVELERIIYKTLEKDREVRCQTASELRADLKRLKRDLDSSQTASSMRVAEQSVAAPTIPARSRRRRTAMALGGAVVLLALILTIWLRSPLPRPKVLGSVLITSDSRAKIALVKPQLVNDGSRLYFSESSDNGQLVLAQVSTTGEESARIPTPFQNVQIEDISPNKAELLIGSFVGLETEAPLWILPLPTGSPRRLGDVLAHDAAWSPDGQKIVYANGRDLFVIKSDGTEARKLVTLQSSGSWLRWSPDGSVLRFTMLGTLWEVGLDGSHLHPLLPGWNNPPDECCASWTPDGRYFVFRSKRNIWAIREQSGLLRRADRTPVQLTAGPLDYSSPVASLDGKRLFVLGSQPRGELVRYDGKTRHFEPYLGGISAKGLSFSRDEKWVAYCTLPEGMLWRSKVDGTQRLQLSFSPMNAALPRWSPDGKQIAFMAAAPGRPWKIQLVSAEGGSPQPLYKVQKIPHC
jgi:serine/threonine protein kinase